MVNALGRQEAAEGEEGPKPFVYYDPIQKVKYSIDPITSNATIGDSQESDSGLPLV